MSIEKPLLVFSTPKPMLEDEPNRLTSHVFIATGMRPESTPIMIMYGDRRGLGMRDVSGYSIVRRAKHDVSIASFDLALSDSQPPKRHAGIPTIMKRLVMKEAVPTSKP